MLPQSAQKILFNRIKELMPAGANLADVVSDVLHVSYDSAYRRIRGETPLVLDEAFELCTAYHISLDELLYAQPNTVTFRAIQLNNNYSFEDYLTDIGHHLQQLSLFTEKKIIYLAKDIPISIPSPFSRFLLSVIFSG
jgi:hypothetical protein